MEKGKLIGKGRTAEVYGWGTGKVVKLFDNGFPEKQIMYEADISQAIQEAGVPSPRVYEIITEASRTGIVYQSIAGKSMLKGIESKPWKASSYARQMARLHVEVHQHSIAKLPSQHERIAPAIKKAAHTLGDRTDSILDYLKRLPNNACVCHGDFHPDNILMTEKDVVAIDWNNAYAGNPLSDVARTIIMIRTPFMPPGSSKMMLSFAKLLKRVLCSTYLNEYMRVSKVRAEDIDAWMLPVAAARLYENVPGEKAWLLGIIDRQLLQLSLNS